MKMDRPFLQVLPVRVEEVCSLLLPLSLTSQLAHRSWAAVSESLNRAREKDEG